MISAINFMDTNYYLTDANVTQESVQTQESAPQHEGIQAKTRKVSTTSTNVFNSNMNYLSILGKLSVSSTSSVSGVSSSVSAKVQSLATEMISLQNQLAELVATSDELAELYATSDELTELVTTNDELAELEQTSEEVKNYQSQYLKLYNQLAEKKEEYNNYINKKGLTESQVEKITQTLSNKQTKNNSSIENQLEEITNKRVKIAEQTVELADLDAESTEMNELNDEDIELAAKQSALEGQLDITNLDLLSSKTTLQTIPEDIANLALQYDELSNQMNVISYQIAVWGDLDTESDEIKELWKTSDELYEQQTSILKQIAQKSKANDFDTTDSTFQALFTPSKIANQSYAGDINYKINCIESRIDFLKQTAKNATGSEKDQIESIRQVYELELANLQTQKTSLNIDNFENRFDTTEENIDINLELNEIEKPIYYITNKLQVLNYQAAELADLNGSEDELAQLNSIKQVYESELEKYQKQYDDLAQKITK